MAGFPGEDFGNWHWGISSMPQQPPQAVGLQFVSLTRVLLCPSKTALGKGLGKGRVRAQKPLPSNWEPTSRATGCPAWPPPMVRLPSWDLAGSQCARRAGLGAFQSIFSISSIS